MTKASDLKPGDKVRLVGESWYPGFKGETLTVKKTSYNEIWFEEEPGSYFLLPGWGVEKVEEMETEKAGVWVVWDSGNYGGDVPRKAFATEIEALRAMNEKWRTEAEGVRFWGFGTEW